MYSNEKLFRTLLGILFVGVSIHCSFGQVGINFRYINPGNNTVEIQNPINNGLGIGLDYWFRLKTKRIEFLPEIGYETFNSELDAFKMSSMYFSVKTQFYLLNFNEDCNCPTFSKDGNTVSKGFFLFVAPEIKMFTTETATKETDVVGGAIIGAGLDFGLADVLTITPSIGYEMTSKLGEESYKALQLGLRAGFRFKSEKKKFRR